VVLQWCKSVVIVVLQWYYGSVNSGVTLLSLVCFPLSLLFALSSVLSPLCSHLFDLSALFSLVITLFPLLSALISL
jgi:hypothetical protein